MRRYVQTARALLAAQDIPVHLNRFGVELSDGLAAVMEHLLQSVPEVVPRRRPRVTFRL